jgi:hypothetical protein
MGFACAAFETDRFSQYPKYCLHLISPPTHLPFNFQPPTFERVAGAYIDIWQRRMHRLLQHETKYTTETKAVLAIHICRKRIVADSNSFASTS